MKSNITKLEEGWFLYFEDNINMNEVKEKYLKI